jgi:predicted DNA-binding transcriptional regulator AlpA
MATASGQDELVYTKPQLARALGYTVKTITRKLQQGLLPSPVRIGGQERWRVDEVRAWLKAGCPNRRDWERMNKG